MLYVVGKFDNFCFSSSSSSSREFSSFKFVVPPRLNMLPFLPLKVEGFPLGLRGPCRPIVSLVSSKSISSKLISFSSSLSPSPNSLFLRICFITCFFWSLLPIKPEILVSISDFTIIGMLLDFLLVKKFLDFWKIEPFLCFGPPDCLLVLA